MSDYYVTIGGQPIGPEALLAPSRLSSARPDARDASGMPSAVTQLSPNRWADGGVEETLRVGLPLTGLALALLGAAIALLIMVSRRHRSA